MLSRWAVVVTQFVELLTFDTWLSRCRPTTLITRFPFKTRLSRYAVLITQFVELFTVWHLAITVCSPYNTVRETVHRLTLGYHGMQSLKHSSWNCSPSDTWLSRYAVLITQFVELFTVWHLAITVRSPYNTVRGTVHRLTPGYHGMQSLWNRSWNCSTCNTIMWRCAVTSMYTLLLLHFLYFIFTFKPQLR